MLNICWPMLHSIARLMWSILINGNDSVDTPSYENNSANKRNKLYSGKKLVIVVLAR
jgi:hypothetical protein